MERDPAPQPSSSLVVGAPYRALRTLRVWVFTFDELEVETALLHEGAVFQAWQPSPHALGHRVPITRGEGASAHGWDAAHPLGAFLDVPSFESSCQPAALPVPRRGVFGRVSEPGPSPFDELPAILERLAPPAPEAARARLYELSREHARWVAYELAASSFDNTESMRHGADQAAKALAEARALLRTLRGVAPRGA